MLDFRLYSFLTLSQTLNYTKAAQMLCITQPAVTQHIKYLEASYGCALFTHEGKQLMLTPQGEFLQRSIQHMVADEQRILEQLKQNISDHQQIRFGATLTIGEYILPKKIQPYLEKHPNINLTMRVENTQTLIDMMRHGEIDFAFIEGYFHKNDFYHKTVSKERYIAVCAKDYPLQTKGETLEDLLCERLIIREVGSGTREILERILQERNLSLQEFKNVTNIGNMNAIKYLLHKKAGISFLYETAVKEELEKGEYLILAEHDLHIEREFSFVCLKNSFFHETYLNFLKELEISYALEEEKP